MFRFFLVSALTLCSLCSPAAMAQGNAAAKDVGQKPQQPAEKMTETEAWKKMIGIWRPTAGELAGKPMPAQMKSIRLSISAEKTYAVDFGGLLDKGTIAIDLSGEQMQMKLTGTEGPNVDKVIPAIFKFEKEFLVVCYDVANEKSPTEFKSPDGSSIVILYYERVKDESPAK